MPRLRKDAAQIARERSARVKYTRQARARESKAREKEEADESARRGLYDNVGALNRCWCGNQFGHDWPGRDDGAPHPR